MRVDTSKKKTIYVFRIVWPAEAGDDFGEISAKRAESKTKPRQKEKKKDRSGSGSGDEKSSAPGASPGKLGVTVGGAMVRMNLH